MNRHTKLAIIVSPLLLVGGYIASDQYLEYNANRPKIYQLQTSGTCDILNTGCLQQTGDMQAMITDVAGTTKVNTSYPVDSVAISVVQPNGDETIYGLEQSGSPQYWQRPTAIRESLTTDQSNLKLRIMVKMKGHHYLNEFTATQP